MNKKICSFESEMKAEIKKAFDSILKDELILMIQKLNKRNIKAPKIKALIIGLRQ